MLLQTFIFIRYLFFPSRDRDEVQMHSGVPMTIAGALRACYCIDIVDDVGVAELKVKILLLARK